MTEDNRLCITLPPTALADIDFLRGDTSAVQWVADLVMAHLTTWRELGLKEAANSATEHGFLGLVVGNVPKPLRPAYDPVPAHQARRIKQAAKRLQPVNAPGPEPEPESVVPEPAPTSTEHEHQLGKVRARSGVSVLYECADTSCNWTAWR